MRVKWAGIAQVFGQHGYTVKLLDVNDTAVQRGIQAIGTSLDRLVKKGTVNAKDKAATLNRIAQF